MSLVAAARKTGFYAPPPTSGEVGHDVRIKEVIVGSLLSNQYLYLHLLARTMVEKMDEVFNDPYHTEVMIRGRSMGYVMPDVQSIYYRTKELNDVLDSYNPYDFCAMDDCGLTRLPAATAIGHYRVALHSAILVDEVFTAIRQSEYMLWMRTLKESGEPYAGATSLQQVCDTWYALVGSTCANLIDVERRNARLPDNWVDRLSIKPQPAPNPLAAMGIKPNLIP